MTKLINNALYYSPASSSVTVTVEPHSDNNQLMITSNNLAQFTLNFLYNIEFNLS